MYLLRYVVKPKGDHPEVLTIGGAYVNCWMDVDSMETAKAQAMDLITEDGWRIESLDEADTIQRSECNEESIVYYDQALIDKTVMVFHSWPIDAPDREEED